MFKCPRCDIEVEDEGLCVKCWDGQIASDAQEYKRRNPEKIKTSQRAYRQRRREKKEQHA